MTDAFPLVSVVIVNHNGLESIAECLDSVFAQPYRPIEVIVVDNGSNDGSAALVRDHYPEAVLLLSRDNRGFAGGNNLGVAAAKGDVVVLLNNDAVVTSMWIPPLLAALGDPSVGAVTSRVVTDGVPAAYYEKNGTINYLGYNIMRVFDDLSVVFFAGGASLAFRRSELPSPFPEQYFLYHEDVYLSWRLRLSGSSVRMAQESLVHHRGSRTTRRQAPSLISFYQHRNRLLNCLLFYEWTTLLKLLPYLLGDAAATLAVAAAGRKKLLLCVARSYYWLFMHAGWIARERREIQRARKVSDHSIMKLMSCKVLDGDGGIEGMANSASRLYAKLTGMTHYD